MNELKRVESAITQLVIKQPFFATLALRLSIAESKEIHTFATDGKNLLINTEWCSKLNDKQILTVLCHEILHCAMGHIWRMPLEGDPQAWNMAVDQEANEILLEQNKANSHNPPFDLPDGYYYKNEFKGWASERVYKVLKDRPKDKSQSEKQDKQNNSMGEVMPSRQESQKSQLKEEWERAVIQAVKIAQNKGSIPDSLQRLAEDIKNPKKDWKTILRDYLFDIANNDWSWTKLNRRFLDNDFMLPSLYKEKINHVVFAVDTSGSITNDDLKDFISEAQGALDELLPDKLTVIQCDADIQEVKEYAAGDKIEVKIKGGGGTDFRPVFNLLKKEEEPPKVLIYLTDLEGSFPEKEPEYQVIWVSTQDKKAPMGETICF